jgi:hypothetical protein
MIFTSAFAFTTILTIFLTFAFTLTYTLIFTFASTLRGISFFLDIL